MDQPREDKLVALLEAVSAQLSRAKIYDRVDDDFVDEEDLAKCLGKLVASGRLVRHARPRLNKSDELVYTVPGRSAQWPPYEMPSQPSKPLAAPATTSPTKEEAEMPTGVYKRKKKTDSTTEPGAPAMKKKRKASPRKAQHSAAPRAANGDARFGYFSDGSLQIDCADCKGILTHADVGALREFTKRFEQSK